MEEDRERWREGEKRERDEGKRWREMEGKFVCANEVERERCWEGGGDRERGREGGREGGRGGREGGREGRHGTPKP